MVNIHMRNAVGCRGCHEVISSTGRKLRIENDSLTGIKATGTLSTVANDLDNGRVNLTEQTKADSSQPNEILVQDDSYPERFVTLNDILPQPIFDHCLISTPKTLPH